MRSDLVSSVCVVGSRWGERAVLGVGVGVKSGLPTILLLSYFFEAGGSPTISLAAANNDKASIVPLDSSALFFI